MSDVWTLVSIIGILFALKQVHKALYFFYRFFFRAGKSVKRYGSWAVVTGATDGIGAAYVHELAKRGINIVLVSRIEEKLKTVASDIATKHKVQTKTIAFDFNTSDQASYTKVFQPQLSGLDVGILVNNVGLSYDYPEYFLDVPQDRIDQLINLNIKATTYLTSLVLPGMVERKRGAIINISSASGVMTTPFLSVYSATKAYTDFFSRGLAGEYKSKGIVVQSVHPLYVVSKLSKIRNPTLFVPAASAFVSSALGTLGYETQTTGYWAHELQVGLVNLLPEGIATNFIVKQNLSIRKRALAKKSK